MSLDAIDILAPNPAPFEPHGLALFVQIKGWDTMQLMQLKAVATRYVGAQRHQFFFSWGTLFGSRLKRGTIAQIADSPGKSAREPATLRPHRPWVLPSSPMYPPNLSFMDLQTDAMVACKTRL